MRLQKSGGEVVAVEDVNWKEDAKGLPGRQLGLQLLLRVVADVGIVGFPNAGGWCQVCHLLLGDPAQSSRVNLSSKSYGTPSLPASFITSLNKLHCRQIITAGCTDTSQP
jgi:hypothetical protein